MNPADKQNVPKALPNDNLSLAPSQEKHYQYVLFIAKTLDFFLLPFITVDLSLAEQVRSLSAYAHITAAMYLKHKLEFITTIIKNIIITVACLQLTDNRLEKNFSNVRIQDHSHNFDLLQLAQKLSVAAEISAILEHYPHLDHGALGIDHVNPKSWNGNVMVGSVDIIREWKEVPDLEDKT
ncbi:hypothetical protein BDZ94DRAFT_1285479 [Collybia nuda]|uniref:Uncharacterized protein n=1 Tax=Collybia nuda TaxID=64659 RepID=A0A9P5XWL3_9AGAR|nr:hypothetical protein BDZ94DRAFT_1285479 [Collybia nuda]